MSISKLNPLEMVDHTHRRGKDLCVGYDAKGTPLPRSYKGGRLPRSTHVMGKLDLLRALENSSNPYFSILAGDILKSPEDLAVAARQFSYGARTGIELPAEIPGHIPSDLSTNRTGLYSTAIGQHSLVVTPLQAAVMLSTIANGGHVLKPKIVKLAASAGSNQLIQYPTVLQREIFMPAIIRKILLEGMRRVVVRTQEDHIGNLSRFYRDYPEAISDYIDLKDELVGKTSTAEVMENIDLDLHLGTNMYQHVWFGGISFNYDNGIVFKDKFGNPELVVVVYLRYGSYGKEAAPVAAQIVQKWREIKQRQLIKD
jgi:cell division protein FtsI/penicillin-binding protein 2